MNYFQIYFNDLSWEKQEEILKSLKEYELQNLKEEAKSKNKSLKELIWEDYNIDYDLKKEEKEKFFKLSLDNFLEELAKKRIKNWFCEVEL